jgi:large repetitive protein
MRRGSRAASAGRRTARTAGLLVAVGFLWFAIGGVIPGAASAAGTVLFNNAFNDNTVDGLGTVSLPTPVAGATNLACLTATGNTTTAPLLSCAGGIDAQGSGTLRFTAAVGTEVGGVFGTTSFPTSNGIDATFTSYQYGGNDADGIAFMLAAVNPADPVSPTTMASSGGSLGYSPTATLNGLTNAYLAVGIDVFGNFSNPVYQGTGCTAQPNLISAEAGAVVVRGPGSARVGYCGLNTTYDSGGKATLHGTTRANSGVPVEVLINPTNTSFTSASGYTVPAGDYEVIVTPIGTATRTMIGPLPTVPAGTYPSATWLNSSGIPDQLAFGFDGSTGGSYDVHEVSNVKVVTFNSVPQLAVTSTGYGAATSTPGAPVNYTDTASVLGTTTESSPISLTQTTPAGVVPVGAYGSGWVCQSPIGQSITCTTSSSSFAGGTTLPVLNVVAIVTGASVASTLVQSSSTATASSSDGDPGTASSATAGTLPTTPSAITVVPAIGPITGGGTVTIGGSNIAAATAIEIGTTAQQNAGTPAVLLPCSGLPAAGCFTVVLGSLVISSMPAVATAATVSVTVVTAGVAAAASYVYASAPATPAAPGATAGITSATITWTAPAANGSPITGYTLTPYLAGVAQTPQALSASTTTTTLTGLTPNSSYTFTLTATNLYGTSAVSPASTGVIPYTVPSAPTISTATAGDSSASLSWTAPSNGGSAITSYVVTPYIGTVAQSTQTFTATNGTVTGLTVGTAYTFKVAARNLAGTGPSSTASTSVTPNAAPTLTFATPPSGEKGASYSDQLTVNNGTGPFSWSLASGSLPGGVTLNASTGLLSGVPTGSGIASFTIQVSDGSNSVATKATTLTIIVDPTVTFSPPAGQVSVAYSQLPAVSGGTSQYSWTISSGSLPGGLTLNASTGAVSGTPTTVGSYLFMISATDADGQTGTLAVTIVIGVGPIVIAQSASPVPVVAGAAEAYTVTITNTATSTYTGVTLSDPLSGILDDATYSNNATATSGTVSYSASTVGWSGNLASGASATISFTVITNNPDTGDHILENTVTSATPGTNCAIGSTDSRCVTATTVTPVSITLSGVTSSFTLSGPPNSTVSANGAVQMTVATNDTAGYIVSVEAASSTLTTTLSGDTSTIPIGQLSVRATGTTAFSPLSSTTAVVVHQQSGPSAVGGDQISNDYRVQVPNVPPATYSTTLDYIASSQ